MDVNITKLQKFINVFSYFTAQLAVKILSICQVLCGIKKLAEMSIKIFLPFLTMCEARFSSYIASKQPTATG